MPTPKNRKSDSYLWAKQVAVGVLTLAVGGMLTAIWAMPQTYATKEELKVAGAECNQKSVKVLDKLEAIHQIVRTIELKQRDALKDIEFTKESLAEEIDRSKKADAVLERKIEAIHP